MIYCLCNIFHIFPQENSSYNNPLNIYFVYVYIYSTTYFKKDMRYLKMYKQFNIIQKIVNRILHNAKKIKGRKVKQKKRQVMLPNIDVLKSFILTEFMCIIPFAP